MQTVRVDAAKLTKILTENLEKHRAEHAEAKELYLRDFTQQLKAKLEVIAEGGTPEQRFDDMPVPHSHADDYERVLQMLALSEDSTITLTQEEFSQYVQDDWRWKQAFAATTANYRGKFG